jgi:O-antigen/teichoic acid export membrane protein
MAQRGGTSLARAGVLLGVASVLSNALGYGLTVLLTRSFGPAEYGALGALLGVGLIGGIPAGALTYVLARRTAAAELPAGANERAGLRLSITVGAVVGGLVIVLAPVADAFFHLGSPWPAFWLGVMLLPYSVQGALLGGLLGHERYTAFAAGQLLTALARFAAGVVTALLALSVAGAMAALAVGTFAAAAGLWWMCGPASWSVPGRSRDLLADLARACSAIAGVIVLSNVDLLLARHFLSREESGAYALAALFGKACLWGAQFVPALVFPRLARDGSGRGLLLRSAAAAAGVGAAGILVASVAAGPVVRVIAGDDPGYAEAVNLAVPFAILGTLWALVQLALLAAVAAGDPRPGRLLWVVVAVEALVIAVGPHDSPAGILAVSLVCTGVLAVAATLLVLRDRIPTGSLDPAPLGSG